MNKILILGGSGLVGSRFIELSKDEKKIVDILREKDLIHIDELNLKSGLNSSSMAAAILNLELQGVVSTLPGKLYKLN